MKNRYREGIAWKGGGLERKRGGGVFEGGGGWYLDVHCVLHIEPFSCDETVFYSYKMILIDVFFIFFILKLFYLFLK